MKADLYHDLVLLGRKYSPRALFPQGRMTKSALADRVTWMRQALDLQASDPDKSYKFYWAAWISGCNPPTEE